MEKHMLLDTPHRGLAHQRYITRKQLRYIPQPYHQKAPATKGAFFSWISPKYLKNTSDTWHHLSPQLTILSRFSFPNNYQIIPPTAKPEFIFFISTYTFIPQRNYQIHRSLSTSRMPFALLNLTATWCQLSGIWFRRISKAKGSCCCPGDIRLLLLLLLLLVSTNLLSIHEPQWHLEGPLLWWRYCWQKRS